MSRQYTSMSNAPSHGNASQARAGNARENFTAMRSCGGAPVYSQASMGAQECHFPTPPPARAYCFPAAWTSVCGAKHHRLLDAYGHSRPLQRLQ